MPFLFPAPLLSCIGINRKSRSYASPAKLTPSQSAVSEKTRLSSTYTDKGSAEADIAVAVNNFVNVLLTADSVDPSNEKFRIRMNDAIGTFSWSEYFAELVLNGLESAIRNGVYMGKAMQDATRNAIEAATEFAEEHPVYFTIIALGVLCIMTPWIIEILGFGELGPIEGSFAALWQSRYAGYVPKSSLFSFFQRLGMVWKL